MIKNRIGVVGSGYISRGFVRALHNHSNFELKKVLTRRNIQSCKEFPRQNLLTNSINELIDHSDLVVECSGSVIHATTVVDKLLTAKIPVVTMNSEFHITTGSSFVGKGILTESEGDQPGCLAILNENILEMGFKPLVYGNLKGFLNHNPTKKEMIYWGNKFGLTLPRVTSFTDGTKVQVEQALIANGLGAGILQTGLLGYETTDINKGAEYLAKQAQKTGSPISDYLLSPKAPPGVFIVAEHDENERASLSYLKLGKGPFYTLIQNFHLCHLEIIKTVKRILAGGKILLDNSPLPTIGIAAVAKKGLAPNHKFNGAIGSFDMRGIAIEISSCPEHVPIGLLSGATLVKSKKAGDLITVDDVDIPESLALRAWEKILQGVLNKSVDLDA